MMKIAIATGAAGALVGLAGHDAGWSDGRTILVSFLVAVVITMLGRDRRS